MMHPLRFLLQKSIDLINDNKNIKYLHYSEITYRESKLVFSFLPSFPVFLFF